MFAVGLRIAAVAVAAAGAPPAAGAACADFSLPPAALDLRAGITIDQWLVTVPPTKTIAAADIRGIREAGFRYVRLPVNPAPLLSGERFAPERTGDLRDALEIILGERMPVLVVVHPEPEFKRRFLLDAAARLELARILDALAGWLAAWPKDRLAFGLMAEPFAPEGAVDWNWSAIQRELLLAVRRVMPEHLVVCAGARYGTIEGLLDLEPAADPRVVYDFHCYDPFTFTHQGAAWTKNWAGVYRDLACFRNVPYPSTPEDVAAIIPAIVAAAPADHRADLERHFRVYGEERWDGARVRAEISKAAEWARAHRAALMCGEFGVLATAPAADRLRYLRDVRSACEERGIGWAVWSYHTEFRIAEPDRRIGGAMREALTGAR